ncbi:MAG: phospholipase D-like domain-containing protein [Chloroflexota bacterium]
MVEALTLDFERHWWFLGGEPRTIAQSNSLGTIPVAPLFQTPAQPDNRDRLLRSMEQATTSIHVMCPYITSEAFLTTLARAAQRGVDVDIIYPDKHNDEPVTVQIFRTYIHSLQQAGVSIYACNRRMIHTKMTIVDDRDVFVGSYNLNNRSARHDFELSVVLELPQAHIVMARYRHISDLLPPQRTQQRSLWLRLIQPYT